MGLFLPALDSEYLCLATALRGGCLQPFFCSLTMADNCVCGVGRVTPRNIEQAGGSYEGGVCEVREETCTVSEDQLRAESEAKMRKINQHALETQRKLLKITRQNMRIMGIFSPLGFLITSLIK